MISRPVLLAFVPAVFVFLWSTGWVVARVAAPHAEPLTFLLVRFSIAGVLLAGISVASGAPWPRDPKTLGHAMLSGVLIHALYLAGVWWAVAQGVPAGLSALIAALQPLFTACLAPALAGETISRQRWAGLGLGLAGILLALEPKLATINAANLAPVAGPLAVNVVSMVAVTVGTFHQKRHVATADLRVVATLQYAGAVLMMIPLALGFEHLRIDWTPAAIGAMAWSVLALSIGAIGLLLLLIRTGEVSRAATLIYLVPPTAAVQAYLLVGETLVPIQIVGMAVTALGVALASRG